MRICQQSTRGKQRSRTTGHILKVGKHHSVLTFAVLKRWGAALPLFKRDGK